MKDNFYRAGLWLILAVIALAVSIVLFSCNPTKRAYKGVAKYEPLTTQDTANFYVRATKLIKPLPPTITPGKTIRVPYNVDKLIKDTAYLRKYRDSLFKWHRDDDSINRDECIRLSTEAFKTGQDAALYEFSKQVQSVDCPPDTCHTDLAILLQVKLLEFENGNLKTALIKTIIESDISKKSARNRMFIIWFLFLAIGAGLFFKFKSI